MQRCVSTKTSIIHATQVNVVEGCQLGKLTPNERSRRVIGWNNKTWDQVGSVTVVDSTYDYPVLTVLKWQKLKVRRTFVVLDVADSVLIIFLRVPMTSLVSHGMPLHVRLS